MIEQARGRRKRCGGVLLISVLAAGFFAMRAAAQTQAPVPPAKSKQASTQYGEIYIVYERLSQDGDRIIADGNVEVHYKNIVLFADHMEVDSKTKDVLAIGKVTLHIGAEPRKPKPGQGPGQGPAAQPAPPRPASSSMKTERWPLPLRPSPPTRSSPRSGWSSTWIRPRARWRRPSG